MPRRDSCSTRRSPATLQFCVLLMGALGAAGTPGCTSDASSCSFLCQGSGVRHMPAGIPPNTTSIELKLTKLQALPPQAFYALQKLHRIEVSKNGFLERIGAQAFADLSELAELTITNSRHLAIIDKDAFWNLPKLKYLSISNTGLKLLPDVSKINSAAFDFLFDLQENMHIETLPSNAFLGLSTDVIKELRLTRNGIKEIQSHAFNGTKMQKLSLMGNQLLKHIHSQAFVGAQGPVVLDVSHTAVSVLPEKILKDIKVLIAKAAERLKKLPRPDLFTQLTEANLTFPSHCCAFASSRKNSSMASSLCHLPQIQQDEPYFFRDFCWNANRVMCFPKPDAFNPCEDIMGFTYLRILIWFISVLAIIGNLAVLTVLLSSRYKLTVPRFLMCHLAFADLCMGVYLILIAGVDVHTRGRYYNYGVDWQTGSGCSIAGFLIVFASELSVYTLTAITLERWYTITFALRLDRRLRVRHACAVMAAGWLFASIAALLPIAGVSSFSKVSICLPMDVETVASQAYVVALLLLNVAAFLVVCVCYLCIYLSVRKRTFVPASADMRVAKRMAVLIFTDFLCMAPISFFAISAALKLPLITVSHAKVLLVLFYPINSCANPFLYAFCTKTFKRDFFILASRFGCFKARAQMYRTETSLLQNGGSTPTPKTCEGTLYSLVPINHSH
ncbi:follicle-stimulating hormone receptor-like isoform X2 [Paramormyrops kingsleyae]|uniref:follicle-stimulating hormone receptor-like isoform X2 n=1 Tax=Paramormyrops kingsleyae TaxID=1676925 RepID=UPI003B96C410